MKTAIEQIVRGFKMGVNCCDVCLVVEDCAKIRAGEMEADDNDVRCAC